MSHPEDYANQLAKYYEACLKEAQKRATIFPPHGLPGLTVQGRVFQELESDKRFVTFKVKLGNDRVEEFKYEIFVREEFQDLIEEFCADFGKWFFREEITRVVEGIARIIPASCGECDRAGDL